MSNKTITPKLRFPEFENVGDWKYGLIKDYFSVGSSKRVLQRDWIDKGIPFYRTRELVSLSKNKPFSSEIYISENLYLDLSKEYGVPTKGDFLISGVGTLGVLYQVKTNDKFYFKDGNVLWFKLEQGINSDYFKYCFQSKFIQKQIFSQSSASTVGTYTIQNAKKTKLYLPKTQLEQQKIADCLTSLDDIIAAQNQKLNILKTHKKGLMQNLFPANGKTTPKLRFPEFKNVPAWEEKKLGNIGKTYSGLTGKTKVDFGKGERYIQYMQVFNNSKIDIKNCMLVNIKKNEKQNQVQYGDIFFTTSSETPNEVGFSSVLLDKQENIYLNSFCFGYRSNSLTELIPNFSKFIFRSGNVRAKIIKLAQGITRFNISKVKFMELQILIPKPEEQHKIADCLTSLDDIITSQTKKIDTLKAHKKGLMQQLFPATDKVGE